MWEIKLLLTLFSKVVSAMPYGRVRVGQGAPLEPASGLYTVSYVGELTMLRAYAGLPGRRGSFTQRLTPNQRPASTKRGPR